MPEIEPLPETDMEALRLAVPHVVRVRVVLAVVVGEPQGDALKENFVAELCPDAVRDKLEHMDGDMVDEGDVLMVREVLGDADNDVELLDETESVLLRAPVVDTE